VAIIQATRALVNAMRSEDNSILLCIADCILGCLEGLVEYFNMWAYVYVGLYGYPYLKAGKSVMELFHNRGWDAVIADNLVSGALFMISCRISSRWNRIWLHEKSTSGLVPWFDVQ
jgi:hypothetical protein